MRKGIYKLKERDEAYRLAVEEGIFDLTELGRRVGLSRTTLRKFIGPEARKDHMDRVRMAKALYIEKGLTDVEAICAQARISPNLWAKIYEMKWDTSRAEYVAEHPVLYSTGQILQQAAELLLQSVKTAGYSGEDVKQFINLANAFESFRTGEHRIEMSLVGLTDFAHWFRDHAKELGVSAGEVRLLARVLDRYRHVQLQKLRERV